MNIYSKQEIKLFKKLNSEKKVQDFLNSLKINFEEKGDTCMSPRRVLETKKAHCMEGAMLAAAVLEFHKQKPYVMDLRSAAHDFDHVVCVFKRFGCYGAVSKTNHAVLRYREPIYRTLRELALSYFHEYFDDDGEKTLRQYSRLLDLGHFDLDPFFNKEGDGGSWRTAKRDLFEIPEYLDTIKHFNILTPKQIKNLRPADDIEIQAGKLVEYTE